MSGQAAADIVRWLRRVFYVTAPMMLLTGASFVVTVTAKNATDERLSTLAAQVREMQASQESSKADRRLKDGAQERFNLAVLELLKKRK